jgi:hypothetical protein
MKKLLLCFSLLALIFTANSQCVGIEIEEYYVHPDEELDNGINLLGSTTYRVYAVCQNETDFVSAVFGVGATPSYIHTTTDFFQSTFGGVSSDNTIEAVIATFPSLEWDSWVTVGKENSTSDGPSILTAQDIDNPWISIFDPGEGAAGANLDLEGSIGGSWFTTYGTNDPEDVNYAPNGYAGGDFKVLVAQVTSSGTVSGCLRVQTFVNGDQGAENQSECYFFSNNVDDVPGCTDEGADNYDPAATVDDGSCLYPCAIAIDGADLTDPTCSYLENGSIVVSTSGGQQVVEYSVNGGDPQLTGIFNNLGNGSYTITVSDAVDGCFAEMTYELNTDEMVVTAMDTDILCAGDENGVITVTAEGGTGDFMFGLEQGIYDTADLEFTGLGVGTYTVYAQDENGCITQSNSVSITAPLGVTAQISSQIDASCFNTTDGACSILATGGTPGYTYSINGVDFQDGTSFADLMPGDYDVTVMDMNGCLGETMVTIGAPDEITLDITTADIACNGETNGSIDAAADGGNGGFQYSFDGGDYSGTSSWIDLAAGDYVIGVIDANECTTEMTVTISEPDAVDGAATPTDVSCFGDTDGSISVDANGGTPGYEYSIDGNDPQSDDTFSDLAPGDYEIVITDSEGCVSDVITVTVGEPDELEITDDVVVDDSGAGDGSIDITVEGGTGTLDFDWTGPGNFTANTEDIENLDGGAYEVTITDENGCEVTMTFDVVTGVEEYLAGITFQLTPNPNNGEFWLTLNGVDGRNVFYNVFDATGREITAGQINAFNTATTFVDMSSEADGMYFLRLTVDGQAATAKIAVQR